MKKIINLSLCLLASSLLLLGCQKSGGNKESSLPDSMSEEESSAEDQHKHKYSSDWSFDHENHWHDAICGHNVIKDGAPHQFATEEITDAHGTYNKYTCEICGYVYDDCRTKEITWVNWNDEKIYSEYLEVGVTPEYDEATYGVPRKHSDDPLVGYEFVGWEPTIVPVTEAATYKAHFDTCDPYYVVRWLNWDGSVLETDGKVLAGAIPSYDGDTPTRPASAEQTYTFTGWNPDPAQPVLADTDFVAQYNGATNSYPIRWENYDQTLLDVEVYEYGETPSYKGTTPAKTSTDPYYYYTFKGWSPDITTVTAAQTYTATYNRLESSNQFIFELDGNNYKITGLKGAVTDLYIPAQHEGKYVTEIAVNSFLSYLSSIKTVQFQSGSRFTTLPESLFMYARNLQKVDMSNSMITSIPKQCFFGCDSLVTVVFSASTTAIGNYSFANCIKLNTSYLTGSEKAVKLENVTTIGESAFYGNTSLIKVYGSKVENIGNWAFGVDGITTGAERFTHAYFLNQDKQITIGHHAFAYRTGLSTFSTRNNTLVSIGEYAFMRCESLPEEGLKTEYCTFIGKGAFHQTNIKQFTINIPQNGSYAFKGCLMGVGSLTQLVFSGDCRISVLYSGQSEQAPDYVGSIQNVIFRPTTSPYIYSNFLSAYTYTYNGSSSTEVPNVTHMTIYKGVEYIQSYILKNNTKITQIQFVGTIAEWNAIGKNEHWNRYSSLTKIVCNDGVVNL